MKAVHHFQKIKIPKNGILKEVVICIICAEWQLGKLTTEEARRNLGETAYSGPKSEEELIHYFEAMEMLSKDINETDES
jgi:hypothetical protein